jgi:hypothetical protein
MMSRVRGVWVGLAMVFVVVLVAPVAQADFSARSRHSLYRDRSSKRLALPVPTVSRPTLVRLPNGKLRVVVVVRYLAANWTHRGRAAADRVMVTLQVARDLHSTGPDPASPVFRRVIVQSLHAQRVRRVYTFVLPVKIARRLASSGLFAANRARRRARAAERVWVDVEQDRDYQFVNGRYDWREGSAATATAPGTAAPLPPAVGLGAADAYAAGSVADDTCSGQSKYPCGYLTVRNATANGIYCPTSAEKFTTTTNGESCGEYGNQSGSQAGPATVGGTMNQSGVNVGMSGSAVQCVVEGTVAGSTNSSNPVGFNNVDSTGNPQPYAAGSVSVSSGSSGSASTSGYAVTEPIVANDTAQLASSNEIAGVSGYMNGALGLVWGAASFAGVSPPSVPGLALFALDVDYPTPGSIVMAVLGIAKAVIEDSCDGNPNTLALATAEPGGGSASTTLKVSKEGIAYLNAPNPPSTTPATPPANGLQLSPSSDTYSPPGSSSNSASPAASPLYLSMYAHGYGVQGQVAGTGANTNEVDVVWADYNPCQQQSVMWGESLDSVSSTSTLCNVPPPTSPGVSSSYGNVDCGSNNYECPFPAAGFPPPGDTASSTGVTTLPNGPSNCGKTIPSGTIIGANQSYTSPNGQYTLVMQGDGNLVLYPLTGPATFASNTNGTGKDQGVEAVLQSNGNLEVLNSKGNELWQSDTAATKSQLYSGATLSVQNDGTIALYQTPTNSDSKIWSEGVNNGNGTCPNPLAQPPVQVTTNGCATIMPAGMAMGPGATITSPNGNYTLTMQQGGALVLTGAATLWSSTQVPTARRASYSGAPLPGSSAAVTYVATTASTNQSGGLVVGTGKSSNKISFQTNTNSGGTIAGVPGFSYLAVQNDGNLVLYTVEGQSVEWSSGTQQPGVTPCAFPNQSLSEPYYNYGGA